MADTGAQTYVQTEEERLQAEQDKLFAEQEQGQTVDPDVSQQIEEEDAEAQQVLQIMQSGGLIPKDHPFAQRAAKELGGVPPGGFASTEDATKHAAELLRTKGLLPGEQAAEPAPLEEQGPAGVEPGTAVNPFGVPGAKPTQPGAPTSMAPGVSVPRVGAVSTKPIDEHLEALAGTSERLQKGYAATGKKIQSAIESGVSAQRAVSNVKADLANLNAATLRTGFDAMEAVRRDHQERKEKAQQQADSAFLAYQDELRKQMEDKPIESWGLGKRIATGIAMALGAVGSAYTGGPNQAMQIVKMGMQRDAELHRRRAARSRQKLSHMKTIYDVAGQHYDDIESQILAAQAEEYRAMERELRQNAAQHKSPIIKANSEKAAGMAHLEAAQIEAKLKDRESNTAMALSGQVGRGISTKLSVQQSNRAMRAQQAARVQAAKQGRAKAKMEFAKEEREIAVKGLVRDPRYKPTVKQKQDAETRFGFYKGINRGIEELIAARKKLGAKVTPERLDALYTHAQNIAKRTMKAAVGFDMSGANLAILEAAMTGFADKEGDFYDAGKIGPVLKELAGLKKLFRDEMAEKLPSGYMLPGYGLAKKAPKVSKGM